MNITEIMRRCTMITMSDYHYLKTPDRILKILGLLEMKQVGIGDIINIIEKEFRDNRKVLSKEILDEEIRDVLKYLEEKFGIQIK